MKLTGLTLPEFPLLIGRAASNNQRKLEGWILAAKKRVADAACSQEDKGVIMVALVDLEWTPQTLAVRSMLAELVSEIEKRPALFAELTELSFVPEFDDTPAIRKYWAGAWALSGTPASG